MSNDNAGRRGEVSWNELIADRLRQARTQAGLSQEELAEKIGLTTVSISKFETGRRQPRVSTLERVAEATGTPLAWFFSEPSEPVLPDFHRRLSKHLLSFLENEQIGLRALLDSLGEALPAVAWTTDEQLNITGRYGVERALLEASVGKLGPGVEIAHRQALRGREAAFRFTRDGSEYVARVGPVRSDKRTLGTVSLAVKLPPQALADCPGSGPVWEPCEELVEALSSEFSRMRTDVECLLDALLHRSGVGLEACPIPAAHLDGEDRIQQLSSGLREWLGVSHSELLGRDLREVVDESTRSTLEPALQAVRETGKGAHIECLFTRSDGSRREVLISLGMDHTVSGGPLLLLIQDITERHRLDYRVRARGLVLSTLVEQMDEGFGVQIDGRFTYVNPGCCRLLGYSREELTGMGLFDLCCEQEHDKLRSHIKSRHAGQAGRYTLSMRQKDGSRRRVTISATPMLDENGEVRGSFAIMTKLDTSEHLDVLLWTVNESGEVTSLSGGASNFSGEEADCAAKLLSHAEVEANTVQILKGHTGSSLRVHVDGTSYLVQLRPLMNGDTPGAAGIALPDLTPGV